MLAGIFGQISLDNLMLPLLAKQPDAVPQILAALPHCAQIDALKPRLLCGQVEQIGEQERRARRVSDVYLVIGSRHSKQ